MKTKYFIKTVISSLIFPLLLFIGAWKIDYFQGYIFLFANLISALMNFWTIKNDTELMTERSKIGKDSKSWDKSILALSGIIYMISVVIASFDSGRYQWSPDFHWSIYLLGVVLMIIGQLIFLTARKENKYFSSVVRIQTDRGHSVCNTGIYKYVRHPGYSGMIISVAALPLLTGSVWSAIPIIIAIILLFLRTHFEDEYLKKELKGYSDYAQKTRQRLIPKIW